MSATYKHSSPYYSTIDTGAYLDVIQFRNIPLLTDDQDFEVQAQYEHRPDLLAYDLYSDANLWWVFAARNPNLLGPDPYFNLVAGIGIYVPTLTALQLSLGI